MTILKMADGKVPLFIFICMFDKDGWMYRQVNRFHFFLYSDLIKQNRPVVE